MTDTLSPVERLRTSFAPILGELAGKTLPPRFRRFTETPTWDAAARGSVGYEEHSRRKQMPAYEPLASPDAMFNGRQVQFLAALGVVLSNLRPEAELRVVDVGGASGHYHAVAAAALRRQAFDWRVIETPTLAAHADSLPHPADISWSASLDEAMDATPHLVVASALLNYVPKPFEVLERITRAPYVFISRLPLWPIANDVPAIQRSRRTARLGDYPTWFFSEAEFLVRLGKLGTVEMRFVVPEDVAFMRGKYLHYSALLVRTSSERGGP